MTTRTTTGAPVDGVSIAVSRSRSLRRPTVGVLAYVVLLAVAVAILVPIVYAILGGFKTNGQLAANPVALLPDPWVFTNYTDVLGARTPPSSGARCSTASSSRPSRSA